MTFTPTPEQRRKYADYEVEIRPATVNHVRISVIDGQVCRMYTRFHRVPSRKKFIVFAYIGCTPRDLAFVQAWARDLPLGSWAEFEDRWFRRKSATGHWYWMQEIGNLAPDPFAQLELELMIDQAGEVHA
jgi:hypothetical protein